MIQDQPQNHKSGFVNIIGNPNVGKSTLMNALVGEHMSIINSKPQTTRHRILGIVSGIDFQIVFSDTPGTIHNPNYKMQKAMNGFAYSIFADADIILFMTDIFEEYHGDEHAISLLQKTDVPKYLIVNKTDLINPNKGLDEVLKFWKDKIDFDHYFTISAKNKEGTADLLDQIQKDLPDGPVYYPKEQLSDKPQRFFVSEIIRGHILELYHQEIPYSSEVVIDRYIETELKGEAFTKIYAEIYVMRKTQKQIVIGKSGSSIKKLGIEARKSIEAYLGNRIHLELFVKVKEKWRDDENQLKRFGYTKQ